MFRLGVALNAIAVSCIAVALFAKDRKPIEGAYFNRSVGEPAFAGVYSGDYLATRTPWLIAALILVALGTAILVQTGRSSAS